MHKIMQMFVLHGVVQDVLVQNLEVLEYTVAVSSVRFLHERRSSVVPKRESTQQVPRNVRIAAVSPLAALQGRRFDNHAAEPLHLDRIQVTVVALHATRAPHGETNVASCQSYDQVPLSLTIRLKQDDDVLHAHHLAVAHYERSLAPLEAARLVAPVLFAYLASTDLLVL